MNTLSRLARYARRFLSDARYRNHVLTTIERHARGAASADVAPDQDDLARAGFLRGRRIFAAGGCELTFILEHLSLYGIEAWHSFDRGRPADPMTEISTPGSKALSERWDYHLLSVSQVARGVVSRLQTEGLRYARADQEHDLDEIVHNYRAAIEAIRSHSASPIFLYTYFLSYRPAYGVHEFRSMKSGLSLVEWLHAYHLRIYQLAKEHDGVYVLDAGLAVADAGMTAALDPETSNGIYDHPTRGGAALLARHLVRQLAVLEPGLRRIKCAVFDLDGTLWAGVLREDGPMGVAVQEYYLEIIRLLAARGILIAICSKNDEVELEHLPGLLGEEIHRKIVCKRLGWNPKSEMLRSIAAELGIGIDSLALIDDADFERAEVRANAPEVLVLTPEQIFESPNMLEFQPLGETTPEAVSRTEKYREQSRRQAAERSSSDDLHAFLTNCQLRLELRAPARAEVSRVFELLQRTNQLNATLTRTSLERLVEYMNDPERYLLRIAKLDDRFGDYGLIGFAACEKRRDEWEILDLAFSCRCAGRGVEQAILNHIGTIARAEGVKAQTIQFLHGPRNGRMFEILLECGFAPAAPARPVEGRAVEMVRALKAVALDSPSWLSVSAGA